MPWFLPPHLLTLFEPREPIRYLPPLDEPAHEKEASGYSGIAAFVSEFEDPKDTPPPTRIETREEKENKKRQEKEEQVSYKLEQDLALWTPRDNPAATSDPYKTLFVGRLNYDTSESKLRREFEEYGPIRNIIMVHDKFTGRSRGYAFIEYERERDMRSAYKYADGKKIDGRRVVVDIERGRTIEGWKPRRLGGGLGGRREQDPDTGRDETSYEARNRENDRGERSEHKRHRSRSRDRRRRSRDRRTERYVRDRSRDRRRGRDLGSNDTESRKRRRSHSTESDRKRRRSRSNNRREYDHGDKDSRRRNRYDTDEGTWYERKTMTNVDNQGSYNNNSTDCGEGSNNYSGPYKCYGAYR